MSVIYLVAILGSMLMAMVFNFAGEMDKAIYWVLWAIALSELMVAINSRSR